MLTASCALRLARDDTLIQKARSWPLKRLARMYGFPYGLGVEEASWSAALRACAYGPRGTLANMLDVLEAVFDQFSESYAVTLTAAPGLFLAGGWAERHSGRLVRVTAPTIGLDALYASRNVPAGVVTTMNLIPLASGYWGAPDFSAVVGTAATATILPFILEEPNACELRVLVDGTIWSPPPTYIQTDGTVDRTVAAPGQPYGGHILPDVSADGDQSAGPFPLYVPGADLPEDFSRALDGLMAGGCSLVLVPHDFG